MAARTCLVVVLAAGEGTRMRSDRPKVLHPIAGLPMIAHIVRAAEADHVAVVIGPDHEAVAQVVTREAPRASIHVQAERRGTAHAALSARPAFEPGYDDVLVVFGDTPLLTAATLARLRAELAAGAAVVVGGMEPPDPTGFGRLVMDGDRLTAIREEKDASPAERRIRLVNGGVMGLAGEHVLSLLEAVRPENAQREFYLTGAVEIANARGLPVRAVTIPTDEVFGVNTRADLAAAEALFQARRRRHAMLEEGASLIAPETVFFSHDTRLGRDVVVEPYVVFGPGVTVADGAVVHAFSHVEGARIAAGASVGPFARLRPGAEIGEGARIGNFVEVKNAAIAAGAKVNHLSYVGDASVGARANLGAGTITCNYDGFAKHHTEIGAGAFIGSNSALVAPVAIGAGAYVASGSVITEDVSPDALAIARGRQVEKPDRARAMREALAKRQP